MAARKKKTRRRKPDANTHAAELLEKLAPKPFEEHPEVAAIVQATLELVHEDAIKASRTRKPRRYADSSPRALFNELKSDGEFHYPFGLTKFRTECEQLCPELYKKYWARTR